MDDVEYFKERKRMTEDCKYCVDCPLNLSNNGKRLSCGKFENNVVYAIGKKIMEVKE